MRKRERNGIAVVLARGGSKGVPGKNVALVGGRPAVAWTIESAQRSASIAAVLVSTDDPRVKAVASSMGAKVVDRPAMLATDTARVDDAARHAAAAMGEIGDGTPIVILYASVPVRPDDLIDRAAARLLRTGCDSVQSYAPVGKYHPWWTVRVGTDDGESPGQVRAWEGPTLYHGVYRRQELPPAYVPDGGVMAVSRRALFREIPGVHDGPHAFLGRDRRGVITREGEVVDIDTRLDLLVADAVLRDRRRAAA